MPSIPYFEIHAFADPDLPFSGNPAGVCLMEAFPDDQVLKGIAASNNLSETAFLVPADAQSWHLRWFTPTVEVDLCGHATLAAGAVVLEYDLGAPGTARFDTRSGRLEVSRDGTGLAMDLPLIGFRPGERDSAIGSALGISADPRDVLSIDRIHGAGYQMWVMEDEGAVREARPDHGQLRQLDTNIILTAPGDRSDFVSRFFAPASGVDEDPVTGSAHCTLAPYWAERLGKSRLSARQIGPRPGMLEVETNGGRVTLYGHAPRYLEGRLWA
ncbi:PhzF family phenazine biosynthesis protein [Maricaulis sp.]|uniref:PhzF family phenazine biosynthesis protein n=1 Tax=Maricaulis sp. TaxID=1486257 RepID=UPI003A90F030